MILLCRFLVVLVFCSQVARAQQSTLEPPPLPQVKAGWVPGLALTLTANGKSDSQISRLAALYVPAGQTASSQVPAGAFTARWEGAIQSPLRATCTLSADLAGSAKVAVNGVEVLQGVQNGQQRVAGSEVRLNKGPNKLVIEFQSPAVGDAFFRLVWASAEFYPEPVPPTVLVREAANKEVLAGERIREGRLLFAQHRCIACHDAAGLIAPGVPAMPEMSHDAPVFAEFGARFKEGYLANWINDPHAIRPQTLMPKIFTGKEGIDQRAADMAAFLMTLGTPASQTESKEEDVPLGASLFANLGCITCHTPPVYDGTDEHQRVPLGHLQAKWQPSALREYLQDPQKYYQWTRMPNFRLTEDEAGRLTAFLLHGEQKSLPEAPKKGDAANGGQLVVTAGCLNCHAGLPPTTTPKLVDTLPGKWQRGCMAGNQAARGAAPDFAFDDSERGALIAFAASGFSSVQQDTTSEFSHRQATNLRCNSCHAVDEKPSVWSQLEGDIAALTAGAPAPEGEGQPLTGPTAPPFTYLGEKLRAEWAAEFIAGKPLPKPRPWIAARMPGFPTHAAGLATGLSLQHGFGPQYPLVLEPKPELVKAGETLLGENGGFNCMQCHGVGERPPTAVFEAPGINLALSPGRLRQEYYHRWVLFPQRIDPETKMPKFADSEKKTPLTDILDGDADRQYEAIWHYLHTQKMP